MNELLALLSSFGSFEVSPEAVQIIRSPDEFYKLLLVDELEKSLERHRGLSLNILMDYFRGTRGGEGSSASLLKRLVPRASVYLFHTPSLRGWLKRNLPERSNEIIGLQHMKIYIFDDSVIISGANLSDTYFTNRQDRYILIKDCKELVNFLDTLVRIVSSCSFRLKEDGSLTLHEECIVDPCDGAYVKYWEMVNSRVFNHIKSLPRGYMEFNENTTRVYPLVQMGMFSINQEHDFLRELFAMKDPSIKITVASGYFNFIDEYASLISKVGRYSMDVIFASPQANGFYGGIGLSGYIPATYVALSKRFFRSIRSDVRLFEYSRPSWSFHAKGLWAESPNSNVSATLVGSSNYGFRSVYRDLEAQLLIVTTNKNLRSRLVKEHQGLFEHSSLVDAATFLRPDHKVPFWLRMFSRYIRNFF